MTKLCFVPQAWGTAGGWREQLLLGVTVPTDIPVFNSMSNYGDSEMANIKSELLKRKIEVLIHKQEYLIQATEVLLDKRARNAARIERAEKKLLELDPTQIPRQAKSVPKK